MIFKHETEDYKKHSGNSMRWFYKLKETFGIDEEASNASFVGDAKNQAKVIAGAKQKLSQAGYDDAWHHNYVPAYVGYDAGPGWEMWSIKMHSQREMHEDLGIVLIDFDDDTDAVYFRLVEV